MTKSSTMILDGVHGKLISMNRVMKVALMLSSDLIALPLCFLIAMLLRLGDVESTMRYEPVSYVLIALITMAAFAMTGLYRAVVRFIDYRLLSAAGIGLAVVV